MEAWKMTDQSHLRAQARPSHHVTWFDARDLSIRASRSFKNLINTGAHHYERSRILPSLLPLSSHDIQMETWTDQRIIRALERALRRERYQGCIHHWSYDINRHIGLLQALKAERHMAHAKQKAKK
jgi:Family of unknown function (DUF6477)